MRLRPLLAVLAVLAGVLLLGGVAWALVRPSEAAPGPVPARIDVPARQDPAEPTVPPAPAPGGPSPAPATDVVPPPPIADDDVDEPGDADDASDVDDDGDD